MIGRRSTERRELRQVTRKLERLHRGRATTVDLEGHRGRVLREISSNISRLRLTSRACRGARLDCRRTPCRMAAFGRAA